MNFIELAINLERENHAFYLEQAEANRDTELYNVFMLLAKDEEAHFNLLSDHAQKIPYKLEDKVDFTLYRNIFKKILDSGEVDFISNPGQLDIYRKALSIEEKALALYCDIKAESKDERDIDLLNYLISQENAHIKILDTLTYHLNKAVEWVEDAEFGLREEY